jgi:glycosyltransferase involved in cell wall biosynthesis
MDPPPPIGGVTLSVKNLVESLRVKNYRSFYRFEDKLFSTYDVGHVHASNRFKRLLHILWMKLKCKSVIFTVHGLWFERDFINSLTLTLSDGVIFLNQNLIDTWSFESSTPMIKLPSLFKEGYNLKYLSKNDSQENSKLTVLLYAHSKSYKNGNEVYGIEFALRSFTSVTNNNIKIVIVDLKGEYQSIIDELDDLLDIDYYPQTVDFNYLLSRCDIYIRPTCMDGSSLAVQEALIQGKRVVASNVVERMDGVELYSFLDKEDFLKVIFGPPESRQKFELTSIDNYVNFLHVVSHDS